MQNKLEKVEWFAAELDGLVNRYKGESNHYKRESAIIKLVSVFISASITVLLATRNIVKNTEMMELLAGTALVGSVMISVVSAYDALFDPKSLWVRETVTFARLKDLQRDFRYWSVGLDSEELDLITLKHYKDQLDSILRDTLKHWMKLRGASDMERKPEVTLEMNVKSNDANADGVGKDL